MKELPKIRHPIDDSPILIVDINDTVRSALHLVISKIIIESDSQVVIKAIFGQGQLHSWSET